jgi:hypothetical protein
MVSAAVDESPECVKLSLVDWGARLDVTIQMENELLEFDSTKLQ